MVRPETRAGDYSATSRLNELSGLLVYLAGHLDYHHTYEETAKNIFHIAGLKIMRFFGLLFFTYAQ